MRSLEVVLSGMILLSFFAARIIPLFAWFTSYFFYIVVGALSYYLSKKIILASLLLMEAEIAFRLMFFDWMIYGNVINHFMTSALGEPPLSQLEVIIWMAVGLFWVLLSRIFIYYAAKRQIGKMLKNRLPNIYNMTK